MRGACERAGPAQRLAGEPGARRIDDDDVRLPGPLAQLLERLRDVAGEERGVARSPFSSAFSIAQATDSSEISTPQTEPAEPREREPDRAGTAVEVVDGLAARQPGAVARERVQRLGHLRVRLEERVRPHAEAQAENLLLDRTPRPRAAASAGSSPRPGVSLIAQWIERTSGKRRSVSIR